MSSCGVERSCPAAAAGSPGWALGTTEGHPLHLLQPPKGSGGILIPGPNSQEGLREETGGQLKWILRNNGIYFSLV